MVNRMRRTLFQFHAGAANRPVGTTKLLVRETFEMNVGTTCAEHGISVVTVQSANR